MMSLKIPLTRAPGGDLKRLDRNRGFSVPPAGTVSIAGERRRPDAPLKRAGAVLC